MTLSKRRYTVRVLFQGFPIWADNDVYAQSAEEARTLAETEFLKGGDGVKPECDIDARFLASISAKRDLAVAQGYSVVARAA